MKPENWLKVKEILRQTLDVEAARRQEFLENAEIDGEILAEVESLLAFEEASEDFMSLSITAFYKDFADTGEESEILLAGQQIGIYEIVREIGYGGMGAVYLATRADGKFSQRVALKLLKREMNTASLRRRFRQEQEILASLEHPNIARLLDAGTTGDKVPFIAMEYVEGLPIDDYCSKYGLDLPNRLDLFRKVCQAVNFAHRNLIVHRDLKPSNILVNDEGEPKLLDFGISKILSPEFEPLNLATVTKLGAMTPGYASPEQLQNKSVTTATDIYSLGVILYELLSGHRPFETKEADFKEIYKAVIEDDPQLPSAIWNSGFGIADFEDITERFQNHRTDKPEIETNPKSKVQNPKSLSGDLDNIILKALRKEPERRYLSAENFAEDIHRYQRGLPVTARPNTFFYRAEKFFKRNKATAFAGILILLAIFGGVAATLWQARVAQAERAQAEIEKAKAEKRFNDVRKLANSYLFDVYPEIENLEGSLKAREKILTNALEYLDSLSNEAGGNLELQSELATAYEKVGDVQGTLNTSNLGNIQAGLSSYEKARKLREAVFAAEPENQNAKESLANNYYVTARTLWNDAQTKKAEEFFEKGLRLRRELVAKMPDSVEANNLLAILLIDYGAIPIFNGQSEKALALFNEALEIIQKLLQKKPEDAKLKKSQARLLRSLGKTKGNIGDYDGGLQNLNQAIKISRELAEQFLSDFAVQRSVWLSETMVCELFIEKGDGQKAAETCPKTTDFPEIALKKEPENEVVAYDLAISHFNAARAFRLTENPSRTIEQSEKAIAVMSKLSIKSPENAEYKRNLAIYETEMARGYIKLGQYNKAIAVLKNVQETLIPVVETDKEATTFQIDLELAYRLSAQAYFSKGEKLKAVESIDKAIAIIKNINQSNSLTESNKNALSEMEAERNNYNK